MAKNFLNIIVEQKKEEIKQAKKKLPETELLNDASGLKANMDARRPFFERLKKNDPGRVNIIAEIKRASPSKGVFAANLDPLKLAASYEKGGAAALSVLTDQTFFSGSIQDLKVARKATLLPVLRKDFLISSYQIYESCLMGADAVLLIVRILSPVQLKNYLSLCRELKLDALVEINSKDELEAASSAGAGLIGINNRNLNSFETDINTAMRLSSLLKPDQTPVAASGIQGRKDIEMNKKFGIRNFLIGESLVKASNPKAFLESLVAS